jgi:methionyl-tRNA formyltransferase
MFMDAGMDTGDMILRTSVPVTDEDTAGSLSERLAPLGAQLLVRALDLLARGEAPRRPQDPAAATYAPMLKREDGFIDWAEPASAIRNRIHGCNPSPGAVALRDERPVKLWRARVVEEELAAGPAPEPGTVVRLAGGGPVVAAGVGVVQLLELQPESRPRMSGGDYLRGYPLTRGQRFTPPPGGQPTGSVP